MIRQNEIAKELGISKSYLSMILAGQRRIPEGLEKPISELVHKNQSQKVPSKQRVERSNRSRDARIYSFLALVKQTT
ncbi:helix-turn-helix domain-containing protein [Chloroflexota bacterium]